LRQRTRRFYNNINTLKIKSIEDYASTIAIIRKLQMIIIKLREEYYLADRISFSWLSL